MSGHSKWATIKRKKAALDTKRGKEFTKLIKEITIAAKHSGGDPTGNPRLRTLLEKAREVNMPHENTIRAIKRGTGELPGVSYEEQMYEGYGPHGIAVMVEALTDNKNRTVAELRRLFSNYGGNLAEAGAVGWMFKQMGVVRAYGPVKEDLILEELLNFDITDFSADDDHYVITTDPKSVEKVKQKLQELGLTIESAQTELVAQNSVELSGQEAHKATELLSALDDNDDVQNVYTNLVEQPNL
jgi:YebC/PmpR family DNA-binding regulatory protein